MNEQDRVELLYGPYQAPRCKVGRLLRCRMRGQVRVGGITDAPIPWPRVRQLGGNGYPSLILCGDLVRAVQLESATAVAYWFGVTAQTVTKWRRVLGVEPLTKGTSDLLRRWSPETVGTDEAKEKLREATQRPLRNAKIAGARRGKPRPQQVIDALRKANVGRKASVETRTKMSEAHKQRYQENPHPLSLTTEQVALLGTAPDAEIGERIGKPAKAVHFHRKKLGIAAFVKRKPLSKPPKWTPAKDALLGTAPDHIIARKLRCSPLSVFNRRRKLGIPPFRGSC